MRRWRHPGAAAIGTVLLSGLVACGAVGLPDASAQAQPREQALARQIAQAAPGSTVTVPPGRYGVLALVKVDHAKPVTVRLTGVTLKGLVVRQSKGLRFEGGTVNGEGELRYGVHGMNIEHVSFRDMEVTGTIRGFVIGRSSHFELVGNRVHHVRAEGINVAGVQNVLIKGNSCRDFSPIPAVYDANGKRLRDGDHPDCIQGWSRPGEPPNVDIVITGNTIEGEMQGIFLGNHVRNGVDDGGFDRVQITDNVVRVNAPNGIALGGARNSRVSNNRVSTIPGSKLPNGRRVRTNVRVMGDDKTIVCGNTVGDFPDHESARKCRDE